MQEPTAATMSPPETAADPYDMALAALRATERKSILSPTAVDEALKNEPTAWYAVYKQTNIGT
jgi:hypothetical protein